MMGFVKGGKVELAVSLIFKKKSKKEYVFLSLRREEDDPDTICIYAENDSRDTCLYFDMESLKELSLLINEFLVKNEDISICHRTGDFGMHGAKVGVKDVSIDMCNDKISAYFADSLDAENKGPIFIIENKKGETFTLLPNIDQCRMISKALKQYVFAHWLMNKTHEKKAVKAKAKAA